MSPSPHAGQAIAAERKLAGLSQRQLAARVNYSLAMVKAVEQGREPASPAFIAATARVLRVEPERLTGVPYYETLEADGPLEGLTELGAILAEGANVRPAEPASLQELTRDLAEINDDCRNDRGRAALHRLPLLIRQLHGALDAADNDDERGRVFSRLAHAYMQAEGLTHRFGFMGLTMLALDRLDWAASHADDPLYSAQAKLERKKALMHYGSFQTGLELVEEALDMISGDTAGAIEVRGFAHLSGAVLAARDLRPDVARDHIAEARNLAQRVNGEYDRYGTSFSWANVEIHAVAVELESGDPGRAAREGSALVLPSKIPPPRAGHHWQDVSRAWLLAGKPDKALDALNQARRIAPQQTRLHPAVRVTIHGIAAAQHRRTPSLAGFASWLGVQV